MLKLILLEIFFFTLIYGLDYGPAGVTITIAEDAEDHLIKLQDPLDIQSHVRVQCWFQEKSSMWYRYLAIMP